MATTTYSNVRQNAQSTIFGIINSDSTITTAGVKVVDGVPKDLISHRAAYIAINTPQVRHNKSVLSNTRHWCEVMVPIVVSARSEGTARELADVVCNALESNQDTTRAVRLTNFSIRGDVTNQIGVGDPSDRVYTHDLTIRYNFNG